MLFKNLGDDISGILARDPAARSRTEVVLCYPGFHALLFYRVAHGAWRRGWRLVGRFISHLGRIATGIEIHPGARIGRRLFIDHGMGVVIGETAEIGDDVTLYQGVTLGGTSLHGGKRHPTLENGVIAGAGAQVLGPFTVGAGARIGANAVVVGPVPAGATMVGIPARVAHTRAQQGVERAQADFCAYGIGDGSLPDPVQRVMSGLLGELVALRSRVNALESAQGRNGHVLAGEDEGADDEMDQPGLDLLPPRPLDRMAKRDAGERTES